jgi:alkanesulfonate monooxygenase
MAGMDPEAVAAARKDFDATASEGQRRMAELSGRAGGGLPTDPRDLLVHDNVWSGIGLVRGGAGTALVGSHEEVADRIEEYRANGFDEFILSGYPHLEEAWRTGDGLLPELRRRKLLPELGEAPAAGAFTFR